MNQEDVCEKILEFLRSEGPLTETEIVNKFRNIPMKSEVRYKLISDAIWKLLDECKISPDHNSQGKYRIAP
jgi:hypothetical protein